MAGSEQQTVARMIALYCRANHGNRQLCVECAELLDYAEDKTASCPHGANKPTCQHCKIHCYDPEHRERIRNVMRYAGPRMLLRHPVDAIRHLLRSSQL
jgi:YbgA-like uncharacterized protein